MAGSRVGYIVSSRDNIERLLKFRPMYEISSLSNHFMVYLLKNYKEIKKYLKEIKQSKIFFSKEMKKMNLVVPKSYANFQLVEFESKFLKNKIFKKIINKNINITKEDVLAQNNYLRFTLAPKNVMGKVIKIIKQEIYYAK